MSSALGLDREPTVRALRQSCPARMQMIADWQGQMWPFHAAPAELAAQHQLLDTAVELALDQAGITLQQRENLPVFLGSTCLDIAEHEQQLAQTPDDIAMLGPHCAQSTVAMKQRLALEGPDYTVSTACSSAANALLQAHQMIQAGLIDTALVVGVEVANNMSLRGFASLMLLSQAGYRPFDSRRDGLILGEAVGAVVISKHPPTRGPITQLLGGANRCAPENPTNAEHGQLLRVMRLALQESGIDADQLIAIKAHGTGTPSNDRAEGQALDQLCPMLPPMTSLKPYFGHTLGACGLSELVGLLYAWDEGFLPATPGFEQGDEEFTCEPISKPQALPNNGAILVNCFGFGGNNTSLVISR